MQKKAILAPDKGINKYLPSFLVDDRAWTDGNNVHFGVGYVEKVGGYKKFLNFPDAWAVGAYSLGDFCVPTTANDHVYRCTTAGESGLSEPTWTTGAGDTIADGTVVWTEVGVNKLSDVLQAMDSYYQFDGDGYVMAITTTRCYVYDPNNNTFLDITGPTALSGSINHPVVTENAQDFFVFTNGVDPVKYWNPNPPYNMATIADLPGLNDCEPDGEAITSVTCKTLLYFKNFLLLGGTTENGEPKPQRVRWSCLGDITKWKNVENDITQSQAGWADVSDDVSWVQALRPLGNYIVVYKERAIVLLNYVGGNDVWDKWSSFIGTGVLATKAVVDLGDEHIFVGNDNIYSFDGREPVIAGDDIAKDFFRLLNPDKYEFVTGFYVEEVPELWFAFVSVESAVDCPDKAIVYNSDTKAWSMRDMPMTAFGYYNRKSDLTIDDIEFTIDGWNTEIDTSVNLANAPINLCGDNSGNVYVFDGDSFDGTAIDSFLTSKLFDLDDPTRIKRLLRLQFMISREASPYGLPVYVGAAGNVDEDMIWYGPYDMRLDRTYPPWVDVDVSGRYLCVRLGTVNADEPFRLTGYTLFYEMRGDM